MKTDRLTKVLDATAYGYGCCGQEAGTLMDPESGRMDPYFRSWAEQRLTEAVADLQAGRPVAFPTETVYGLGADIACPAAVAQIYELKGRPDDNPLIVHLACRQAIEPLVSAFSPQAKALSKTFMPGPLTLVTPRSAAVPDIVTAGLDTVGIRIPESLPARAFIALSGRSVAAPSANLSGSPSPTEAAHVLADLGGRLSYIIDGGPATVGLESTVLDVSEPVPVILRPGKITAADIISCLEISGTEPKMVSWRERIRESELAFPRLAKAGEVPRAPGMKYRHYAPSVPVEILDCAPFTERVMEMLTRIKERTEVFRGKTGSAPKIGLFAGEELIAALPDDAPVVAYCYGAQDVADQAAKALFAGLRSLDRSGVDLILAEAMPFSGLGTAYMNRLSKAAAGSGELGKLR